MNYTTRVVMFLIIFFSIAGMTKVDAVSFPGGLIVGHNAVREFDNIPSEWLEAAKALTLHYGHTSHGSQINSGILALESTLPTYSVAIRTSSSSAGLPSQEDPIALRVYDGNPSETYIEPDDYWDGTSALNRTRAVSDTDLFDFSMWSWCGQQSSNTTATVQQYLDNLNQLESEYPDMRFIYMTGHTDGSNTPTTSNTLKYNNELVRQHARDNNKIVFDFADIESYDPDGTYYPTTTDACPWCTTWCANNPSDCVGLAGSCAHSHPYNCKLKAKAFWYLMARLAGWDGGEDITPSSYPVYRFWSDTKQGHFYTLSESERDHITAIYPGNVWRYERIAYNAYSSPVSGITPIYRFWSNQKQHHFYTASESEKDYIIATYDSDVWNYERVAFYAYPTEQSNTSPVYRFWSDTKQGHFFTISESEKDYIIATYPENIWRYEGIAWYGVLE